MYRTLLKLKINLFVILLLNIVALAGCAAPKKFLIGQKSFTYNIPPLIKIDGVKTIAVLSSRSDASQSFQAKLMEGLQKLNVNIIDMQQLMNIVQERKLKVSNEDLSQFGIKTNVDLFLVAEVIGPNTTAFKIIEKDGRVNFARFVEGRTDEERIKNIVEIFSGYKRTYTDELGYMFPSDDNNAEEFFNLHNEGKYQELEGRFKQTLSVFSTPKFKEMLYRLNLSNLYEIQKRFGEALEEIKKAEQVNSALGTLEGHVQPEFFIKAKELLKNLIVAENDSKASIGSLVGVKQNAPHIAVLEFDTKSISDKSVGWLAATFLSTKLAQSNFNIYDREYFRSLIETESKLSEKEQGELFGVNKLVYGKFLKKTQVTKIPTYKTVEEEVRDSKTYKLLYTQKKEVVDRLYVNYELEIQGRITDVKTGFGKFQTVKKEPISASYSPEEVPTEKSVEAESEIKLYKELAMWIENMANQ